ncbi:MAG: YigZ family protein [Deltaproteobacteria bacterium]|nr:MAG: YigZ family protein [Deltaproteobacteria bacterium]
MISNPSDEYLTIKSSVRAKTKVEGSIFIATAIPVDSEEKAKSSIQDICKEFFDAAHNCFAFRFKSGDGESERFSDAGEPRGTAGSPILSAIQSENLFNLLVVVTRYFGGVKLGTGGLSRAYRQSALSVLQKADKATGWITSEMTLSYPPGATGKVNQIFSRYNVRIEEQGYEESPTARIEVRTSLVDKVKKALVEATNGQVEFKS